MSEETMSYISERSGSFISPQDNGCRGASAGAGATGPVGANIHMMDEGYHPGAASTYLTEHIGGIYSVEQGRSLEIGFTSNNLPLAKGNFSEDTESQYADELRRQAYIQTLGDGYNISQIGSSVSYPNSPTAEYYGHETAESDLRCHTHAEAAGAGRPQLAHSHSHHHHLSHAPAPGPAPS